MEQTLLKRTVIFVNDAVFSNGVRIPMIGFGTYHATDELGQSVLEEALRCGYRSFDTAVLYRRRPVCRERGCFWRPRFHRMIWVTTACCITRSSPCAA